MTGLAKPLVMAKLTTEPITIAEIAKQIHFSEETVSLILRRALSNGRVLREPIIPEGKRWVYGYRLRCRSCGK